MAIIPCDDCATPIEVGHLGARKGSDRFVCNKCKRKYTAGMKLADLMERKAGLR
jgi:hypothetical protein